MEPSATSLYTILMSLYAFIPGSHPALSLAELRAVRVGKTVSVTKHFLIVENASALDTVALQFRLGGTVKIVEIIETTTTEGIKKVFDIDRLLSAYFTQNEDKIIFGVSVYGRVQAALLTKLRRLGFEIKKKLAESEYPSRFLFDQSGTLVNAAVVKNNLIQRGAEIVVLADGDKLYVGKTATVQDFESYSERDYGRPVRDTKSGTLPPKLAQMMINLSGSAPTATLLDPFCGSGTILQEALRMGYMNVIGSDISGKAIEDTRRNLEWFARNAHIINTTRVFQKDVRNLSSELKKNTVDAIVAETYLGPPLRRMPDKAKLVSIIEELTELYRASLSSLAELLKPGGTVVMGVPFFQTKTALALLPLRDFVLPKRFEHTAPLPISDMKLLQPGNTDRGLLYARPDQLVGREIIILRHTI